MHKKKPICRYIASENKKEAGIRLRRIEGQIRGLQEMLNDDRNCRDVLNQIVSVEKALEGVKKVILRNFVEQCASKRIKAKGTKEDYDEIMEVIFKYS